ncbi:DUF3558 family protein [Allokutzneria oryzae]|uniref:DUF3558 family protein n=1 Tax=Allokutzneria oryzae TaxID=1378989 RepID=A0ABV6A0D7_9PSEU
MGFGGICVVVGMLLGSTACGVPDVGEPVALSGIQPGVVTDWHRVDPCGFVDPALPGRYGAAPRIEPFDFSSCEIPVAATGGGTIYLGIATDNRLDDENELPVLGRDFTRRGAMRVAEPRPFEDTCTSSVVFPDLRYIEASAVPKGGAKADSCGIAAALADSVVATVQQGRHRFLAAPDSSWVHVDPCDLLTGEQVAVVAGTVAADVKHGANRHNCRWGASRPSYTGVVVNIGAATNRLTDVHDLAGRPTQIRAEAAEAPLPPACRVNTQHIGFASDKVETIAVAVFAPKDPEWLCETARGLAEKVWAKLPRTP